MLPQLVKQFLSSNQFASGGLVVVILGGIVAMMRKVPERFYYWVRRQITVSITITNDQRAFHWVRRWLGESPYLNKTRSLSVHSPRWNMFQFGPAPGFHIMKIKGKRVIAFFEMEKDANVWTTERKETMTFTMFGRSRTYFNNFIEEAKSSYMKQVKEKPQLAWWSESWRFIDGFTPRTLESVILPGKEKIVADIQTFKNAKQRYYQLGIPYHRGYLLYGLPGTGKTSLIMALSGHLCCSIYVMKLSTLADNQLLKAIADVPEGSIVLMEDIDAVGLHRRGQKTKQAQPGGKEEQENSALGVTLSGLLNILDGAFAPEGVTFFMTTNHIERLDAALLRPGRCDYKMEFTKATIEQKLELFERFFPGEECPLEVLGSDMVMSEVQEWMLKRQTQEDVVELKPRKYEVDSVQVN